MILTETFPAVARHVEIEKLLHFSFRKEPVILIQFHTPDGINIGRTPEHIGFAIVVDKKIGVLQVMKDGGCSFPFAALRILGIENTHRTRRITGDIKH